MKRVLLHILLMIALLLTFTFQACKQDDPSPVIQVLPAAQIASVSPERGLVGSDITITGINFSTIKENNVVTINDISAIVKSVSSNGTVMVATVPATATSGLVAVKVNGVPASSNHPPVFIVQIPGAAVRVKEVIYNHVKSIEYVYDNKNILRQAKNYSPDVTDPTLPIQTGVTDYSYDTDGNLIMIKSGILNNQKNVFDVTEFQYQNNICQSVIYSHLADGVKTELYVHTYTYQNGVMVTDSYSDPNGNTGQTTYTYTTDAQGYPQTIVHYATFDNIYTYYPGDVVNPDPLSLLIPNSDKGIMKSVIAGFNADYNELTEYFFTNDGNNVSRVQYYFLKKEALNYVIGYNFEQVP